MCLMIVLGTAHAQVGGGFMAGGVFSQVDGDAYGGYSKIGYHLGGFAYFAFSDRIELEPEILIGQRGARNANQGLIYHLRMNYIDVPVLVNFKLWGNSDNALVVQGGPYFGILFGANLGDRRLGTLDVTDRYKPLEIGGLAAMTYEFKESMGISFRWGASLNNILDSRNPWTRNRYLEVALRYKWR